jgi:hypothetical protein
MPISSPESEIGIRKLPDVEWPEGFSLLHLDLYKDDPATTGAWTEHAYQVRFAQMRARPRIDRFHRWLMEECRQTQEWLVKRASQEGA